MRNRFKSKFSQYNLPRSPHWSLQNIPIKCANKHILENNLRKKTNGRGASFYACAKCIKLYIQKIKEIVFSWYGGKCVCCNESNIDFLTLDHIKDDGGIQRRKNAHLGGTGFYRKILSMGKDNFPLDLQILCANCQVGKRVGCGFCPHHPKRNLKVEKYSKP